MSHGQDSSVGCEGIIAVIFMFVGGYIMIIVYELILLPFYIWLEDITSPVGGLVNALIIIAVAVLGYFAFHFYKKYQEKISERQERERIRLQELADRRAYEASAKGQTESAIERVEDIIETISGEIKNHLTKKYELKASIKKTEELSGGGKGKTSIDKLNEKTLFKLRLNLKITKLKLTKFRSEEKRLAVILNHLEAKQQLRQYEEDDDEAGYFFLDIKQELDEIEKGLSRGIIATQKVNEADLVEPNDVLDLQVERRFKLGIKLKS